MKIQCTIKSVANVYAVCKKTKIEDHEYVKFEVSFNNLKRTYYKFSMRNENALDEIITFINNVIETSKKDSLSMCISEDYERSYVRIGCECENEELQPKEFNIRLITQEAIEQ